MASTTSKVWWAAGAAAGLAAAIPIAGARRWRRATGRAMDRLRARASAAPGAFTAASVAGLPEPVARYFGRVLRADQAYVRAAELAQEGEFRIGQEGQGWRPFRARQCFSAVPPGFVWEARIRLGPLASICVRDSYLEGSASMRAALLAVVPLMNATARPELNAAALQRYLAEAIWFPTALLPGQGVTWEGIDARRALATITDAGTSAALEFRFHAAGEIAEIFTPARYREAQGKYVPTPWAVRCTEYGERHGMRIPVAAEVEWRLPEGPRPYWRGRITEIRYELTG